MPTKKNALELALEKGKLKTRPIEEIERDQKETILWAEEVAKDFPVKVRRGRPPREEESEPSRSVTVRFPQREVQVILSSAKRQGLTISEFVRAAAFQAASPRIHPGAMHRALSSRAALKPSAKKKAKA